MKFIGMSHPSEENFKDYSLYMPIQNFGVKACLPILPYLNLADSRTAKFQSLFDDHVRVLNYSCQVQYTCCAFNDLKLGQAIFISYCSDIRLLRSDILSSSGMQLFSVNTNIIFKNFFTKIRLFKYNELCNIYYYQVSLNQTTHRDYAFENSILT